MKQFALPAALVLLAASAQSQEATTYQQPPKLLADLLLAPPTPGSSFTDDGRHVLFLHRSSNYAPVEELAAPELRIAGLRLNPNTYGPSRGVYVNRLTLKDLVANVEKPVAGVPANAKISSVQWNPAQTHFAFLNTTASGIDLYVVDMKTLAAKKMNKRPVNATLGRAYQWENNSDILYLAATKPATAAPPKPLAPTGPVVQQNLGKQAPSRTYQDLIKSAYDEKLFEFYATSQLVRSKAGVETNLGQPGIYSSVEPSPDGNYLLLTQIQKPFSYLVTAGGFPRKVMIADKNGKLVKSLFDLPNSEVSPTGYDNVQNVPGDFDWRSNEPATLTYTVPLDSGLYRKRSDFHDALLATKAPAFTSIDTLYKSTMRYGSISWGDDGRALVGEYTSAKQKTRSVLLNADGSTQLMQELSMNDAYNDPGQPVTRKGRYGTQVIQYVNGGQDVLMVGEGASAKGDLPFLSQFNLARKENRIVWRAKEPTYETVVKVIDTAGNQFITRRESLTDAPNFYMNNLAGNSRPLTNFTDPQPALRNLKKEKISYKREDGIDLTATVYLPADFKPGVDKPLPIFMWAYPREFKSASDAAQVRGSKYRFSAVNWGSPVFYAAMGYCVMDATEFPIVGEGDKEPNDNFVEQLTWNARAALAKIADLGYGDSSRAAVGGHSYGAFMTANLLAHTRLFKAGIARSGAYMRTLTPFGFQAEQRTYWQATDVYTRMSPFTYANNIKDALLLIHGDADNNPGTFPINSERLYNAVKGHGGTVRFVSLPFESHGYAGRENLLHMLNEQYNWLEKYVKGAKK